MLFLKLVSVACGDVGLKWLAAKRGKRMLTPLVVNSWGRGAADRVALASLVRDVESAARNADVRDVIRLLRASCWS